MSLPLVHVLFTSSLSRRILSKAFPFLRMRQIWQEFCDAGPEPALSKTFLFPGVQHHKLDYCLYHHQRHHRMLLEGKPALGQTSWPACLSGMECKELKNKENVRVWVFCTFGLVATSTNVGTTFSASASL